MFSKKNCLFFETFLQSQLVIFMKKVTFWKMKKILSKIFKKARFFAHLRAERSKCQPPIFEGPLFEHFHKVNDENQGVWKIGIKGYPLYIQKFWTLFWPLFEGYSSNPYVFKKSGFLHFRISVYGRLNLRYFFPVYENFQIFVHRKKYLRFSLPYTEIQKRAKFTFFENLGI